MPHFDRDDFEYDPHFPGIESLPCPVTIIETKSRKVRPGSLVGVIVARSSSTRNGKGLIYTNDDNGKKTAVAADIDCEWTIEPGARREYYRQRILNSGHDPIAPTPKE